MVILAFLLGGLIGIILMACLFISKEAEEKVRGK